MRHPTLLAGTALSVLLSTAALAQGTAPPPAAAPPAPTGYPQDQAGAPPQGAPPPAGYPAQNGYPPPPQNGYPPPPQNGYPPPQNGYQQPGYAPQPGYPPPAGSVQQPGYPPPPPGYVGPPPGQAAPPLKHGFLPILYLGVNSFQGKSGDGLSTGFRFGAILGGRVNEWLSINGEITFDGINPSNSTPGTDVTALAFDLAFSPLFHAQLSPSAEFMVGPKVGVMGRNQQLKINGQDAGQDTGSGFVVGANAGAFFALSPTTAIGGLISFSFRGYSEICSKEPGFAEVCTQEQANLPPADKVLGFTGAVTF